MWHKPHLLNALADLLAVAALAALLVGVAVWALRVPALPVGEVVFTAELPHTRRPEIEEILPAVLRGNFFSLDVNRVQAVLESLPWVRRASVRRVWPRQLEISIEEHRALARWGESGSEWVNSYGEVFAAPLAQEEAAVLPALSGPLGTAPEVLRRYGELVGQFRPLSRTPRQVALSPRLAWRVRLDNGWWVDLGREQPKSPIETRLARFVAASPALNVKWPAGPAVVDLRYPNGFALRAGGDGKEK